MRKRRVVITGNEAVAWGATYARAQVICIYPITPQTTIIEAISDIAASGELKAQIIHVESEHSAMAGCIGATYAGARSFTATSAQGLALMHELLHWAGGGRLPIVLANVNRAMAPGWSIWTDQNDSLSQRDTGWMQFYCESNQEVFDTIVQAYKIAEKVMLPAMVVLDAFVLSHTAEIVELPDQDAVDQFLPPYSPPFILDVEHPCSFGALLRPDHYQIIRKKLQSAMQEALKVAEAVDQEWKTLFGRQYGIVEPYRCENAELIFVASATVASTGRIVIDRLRQRGKRVGLLKIRLIRPFPFERIQKILGGVEKVVIFDRNISYGYHGIFAQEIKGALYGGGNTMPDLMCFIGGLGGKDVTPEDIQYMIEEGYKASPATTREVRWL
jgi:pyruvate/2-oxoacid:ferredoxin oxidoreductase alpha subunit